MMRYILVLLFSLVAIEAQANNYSTNFPNAETPMSEGGTWRNGQVNGLVWSNVNTTVAKAFGTQSGLQSCSGQGAAGCNDSTAVVNGTWGASQQAEAVVINNVGGASTAEVELRLNTSITNNSITGYECNYSTRSDNTQYAQIVRWDQVSGIGHFTMLQSLGMATALQTGSVVRCFRNDSTGLITSQAAPPPTSGNAPVFSTVVTATDNTFHAGTPGIGFYTEVPGINSQFGFSSFRATDQTFRQAATCGNSDVQAAVTASASGDFVIIPAGSCSWTSVVTITGKKLAMNGAGLGITNITCNGTGQCLNEVTSSTNIIDTSGTTWIKGVSNPNGMIVIGCSSCDGGLPATTYRFHHNRVLNVSGGGRGILAQWSYGVIDHNQIEYTDVSQSDQLISIEGSSVGNDGGFTPWTRATDLGSANAVFIEDNVFTCASNNEDIIDGYTGARLVIRHNTFNRCTIGFHGTDSGNNRGLHSAEIYSNAWTGNGFGGATSAIGFRSGTGVIYSNTASGTLAGVKLQLYRACPRDSSDTSGWGTCNGTNYEIGSTNPISCLSRLCGTAGSTLTCTDSTSGPANVAFGSTNRDTIGAAGSGQFTTFFDSQSASGWPCRDQIGRGHDQVSTPMYAWLNTNMPLGAINGPANCPGLISGTYVVSGRDFIDNGSANSPKPGYVAFVYPHPLVTANTSGDVTPPSDVTGLTAATISSTQIDLNWNVATDDVALNHYNVERCSGVGCVNFLQISTPVANSFSDLGLTPSTLYRYRVKAVDSSSNQSVNYSSIASTTTQAGAGITNLSIMNGKIGASGVIRVQ